MKRDWLENEFEDHLKTLVPARTTFELAEDMFRRAWEDRSASVSSESKRLQAKSRQLEKDIDGFLKRIVRTENLLLIATYETRIAELEQERALLEEEIVRIAEPVHPFDEMFELSMQFLSSPYYILQKGDIGVKKTVLRLVFSSPLTVSRNTGVRTGESTFPFKVLHHLKGAKSEMVQVAGVEPSRQAARLLPIWVINPDTPAGFGRALADG